MTYLVNNPVTQYVQFTAETDAARMIPRGEKCGDKKDRSKVRMRMRGPYVGEDRPDYYGETQYIEDWGVGGVGSEHEPLPAGDYRLYFRDYYYNDGPKDFTLEIQSKE